MSSGPCADRVTVSCAGPTALRGMRAPLHGLERVPRRARARDLAEHRAGDETRPARIVEVEDAADHLAGRVQARDPAGAQVLHVAIGSDAHAAERECDAASDRVSLKRRLVYRIRP